MTAPAGTMVFAADSHGRVYALSWDQGRLVDSFVIDPVQAAPVPPDPSSFEGFVCRCFRRVDADGDSLPELVLGGVVGTTATVFSCHEDGSGARFVSLGEPGWVRGVAAAGKPGLLVLAVRTSLLEDLSSGFSQTHERVFTTRLVLAEATPDHGLVVVEGQDTPCPTAGEMSEASLAPLGSGEVAVVWCTGGLPRGPGAPPLWSQSTIRVYHVVSGSLAETARRDLEGAWRLLTVGPTSMPGAGSRLFVLLNRSEAPPSEGSPELTPGVYIIDRRGVEGKVRSLMIGGK